MHYSQEKLIMKIEEVINEINSIEDFSQLEECVEKLFDI